MKPEAKFKLMSFHDSSFWRDTPRHRSASFSRPWPRRPRFRSPGSVPAVITTAVFTDSALASNVAAACIHSRDRAIILAAAIASWCSLAAGSPSFP